MLQWYLQSQVIQELRHCLQWEDNLNQCGTNVHLNQSTVFERLRRALTRSRQLFDIWMKNILNLSSKNQKPIDLLILLMMMSINGEKSKYIKSIVRVNYTKLSGLSPITILFFRFVAKSKWNNIIPRL